MLNNREIELQSIIKAQQSKIHSLKHQLTISLKNQQERITEAITKEKKIIEEKDKMIVILMEEGKKQNLQVKQQISWKSNQFKDEYKKSEEINIKLKISNNELQQKLAKMAEGYQLKLKQKQKVHQQLVNKIQILQKQRKNLLQEVQKFNRFYVGAIRRQPEREETLLWVDKLIDFMTKSSQIMSNESKERQQAVQTITRQINSEIKQLNTQYTKHDIVIVTQQAKFLQEMQKTIKHAQQDYLQAKISNQQFWDTLSEVKVKQEKEQLSKLQIQFQTYRSAKQKELQDLTETFTLVEKQKKNLLVSLQEVKSYYQLREKACREEVDFLKTSLQDLLKSQELRQEQFEKQISRMGSQIEHLTIKFYEKIQLPINSVYLKIKQEVEMFKEHFESFFGDSNFQNLISKFQTTIVDYLVALNQQKQIKESIKEAATNALKIAHFLTSDSPTTESQTTSRKGLTSPQPNASRPSSQLTKQQEEKDKLIFQLGTARKHIQKLKQHTNSLEAKNSTHRGTANINTKIIELTAENEELKQRFKKIQRNQKDSFYYNQQVLQEAKISRVNTDLLEQLCQKCERILQFTTQEDEYIISLSKCINSLNLIIINPVDTFQHLVTEINNISAFTIVSPQTETIKIEPYVIDMEAKREVYRDICLRKNESNVNIQKTNLELMRLVRQLLSKNNTKHSKITQSTGEYQKPKLTQSRQMLQKRVKDIHTQKLKIRQEMIQALYGLEQKMKTIEQRSSKRQNFSFIKFEQSIMKKCHQILIPLTPKPKSKETNKIVQQALFDAESKLKGLILQNQGLLKQIEMLTKVKTNK